MTEAPFLPALLSAPQRRGGVETAPFRTSKSLCFACPAPLAPTPPLSDAKPSPPRHCWFWMPSQPWEGGFTRKDGGPREGFPPPPGSSLGSLLGGFTLCACSRGVKARRGEWQRGGAVRAWGRGLSRDGERVNATDVPSGTILPGVRKGPLECGEFWPGGGGPPAPLTSP